MNEFYKEPGVSLMCVSKKIQRNTRLIWKKAEENLPRVFLSGFVKKKLWAATIFFLRLRWFVFEHRFVKFYITFIRNFNVFYFRLYDNLRIVVVVV